MSSWYDLISWEFLAAFLVRRSPHWLRLGQGAPASAFFCPEDHLERLLLFLYPQPCTYDERRGGVPTIRLIEMV